MPDAETIGTWRGHELIDRDGEKIGKIAEIYLDRNTDQPAWVTVSTGLFGKRETLVPITDASNEGEIVRVPFEKDHVKGAPHVDPEAELSAEEERDLYQHYGIDYSGGAGREQEGGQHASGEPGQRSGDDSSEGQPHDEHQHHAESHDDAATGEHRDEGDGRTHSDHRESEGTLGTPVSKEPVQGERGETRLRLKRYVVTEEVRVPVQREEVRLERDDEEAR
jgi:sporulation protein YlmC with PRC-barrel domain